MIARNDLEAIKRGFTDRKHPAHGIRYKDGQITVIFDTICTKDRKIWLNSNEAHSMLLDVWRESKAWLVGRYVIMPDHIHYFAAATSMFIEYDNWVRYWKSQFKKKHQNPDWRFQSDHWDTRMRNVRQYEEKWEYVRFNPVRKELVERPEDWPYQGVLHDWSWEGGPA